MDVIISTTNGCILGCLEVIICQPTREFARFTITKTAFGNTGNIPPAVVASVGHSSDAPFGPGYYRNGIACVSLMGLCFLFTHMMEPPLEQYEIVYEEIEISEVPVDLSKPLLVGAE